MKGLMAIIAGILVIMSISGCNLGFTGLATYDLVHETSLDTYYLVVSKSKGTDAIATVSTSAVSSFEIAAVEECEAHAEEKEYLSYAKSGSGRQLVFDTTQVPWIKEKDSFCIIITKQEDRAVNEIRLDVEPVQSR